MSNTNISYAIHLPKLYWLVEGEGQVKEFAVAYAKERAFVVGQAEAFCIKHGASSFSSAPDTKEVVGVTFPGPVPEGWKSIGGTAKRGAQLFAPKHGTDARREMDALPRMTLTMRDVATALGIPTLVEFDAEDGQYGGSATISLPGHECGFAYPSLEGPFLLWTADYEEAFKMAEQFASDHGLKFSRPDAPDGFEGCRKILKEEWDLVLAKRTFDIAMKAREAVHAEG